MTVFAVHQVHDDVSPAERFGEIVYVNRFYIHGDQLGLGLTGDNVIPLGYRLNMDRAADRFNPDKDFVLIAGDHLQLLALTAILTARFGSFMVLRYDRKISDYIPVRLHSGLVPGARAVLGSNHIGENHAESRNQEAARRLTREQWDAFTQITALDGPVPPKRTS